MTDERPFFDAYLAALVWSSSDGSDEWKSASVSDETLRRAGIEGRAFLYRAAPFIEAEPTQPGMAQAGHDFALTRNGHGAGFWDGGWPVYGDVLTRIARSFGEVSLYVSDRREIDS